MNVSIQALPSLAETVPLMVQVLTAAMPQAISCDRKVLTRFINLLHGIVQAGRAKAFLVEAESNQSLVIAIPGPDLVTQRDTVTIYWYGPPPVEALPRIESRMREEFTCQDLKLLLPFTTAPALASPLEQEGWQKSHWIVGRAAPFAAGSIPCDLILRSPETADMEFIHSCLGDSLLGGAPVPPAHPVSPSTIGRDFLAQNPQLKIAVALRAHERVGVIAWHAPYLGPLLPLASDSMLDIYVPAPIRGQGLASGILAASLEQGLIGASGFVTGNVSGQSPQALESLIRDGWLVLEQGFHRSVAP